MTGNTKVGKSGYYGVVWLPDSQKYRVQIRTREGLKYLGCYEDIEEAANVYDREAVRNGKTLLNGDRKNARNFRQT